MRRYLIFASAGLGLLMYSIDGTAVAVALPNLMRDLSTNLLWASWTISVFYLGVITAMPLAGNLGDNFGRKKVFIVSLVLFTVTSLACGLAPNIYALIAFRFLQGIGGASFLPTASGIVSDHFPESRERVIGLFTSIYPIGGIIGPNLGGLIVSRFSWRFIFYINLPVGVLLMALIVILLPVSKISSLRRLDIGGASFFSGAIFFLIFGLNLMGERLSLPSLLPSIVLFLMALSLSFLFFRHEKRAANPILDLALLKSRPFLAANLLNVIMGAGLLGLSAFIPLYAVSVHKLSTFMSGAILTPQSLAIIPASTITSFLLKRYGYRKPMVLGLITGAFATILLGPGLHLWRILGIRLGIAEALSLPILVSGIGQGLVFPASNNACIELMPAKIGTIVGLRGMFRNLGLAVGVSLITVILHLSPDPAAGFSIVFISFGVGLLCALPLIFLMPAGVSPSRPVVAASISAGYTRGKIK